MAAEMSTGALAMLATELAEAPVALIIVNLEAGFEKKAQALTTFTCEDGAKAFAAVAETARTGEPATAPLGRAGGAPARGRAPRPAWRRSAARPTARWWPASPSSGRSSGVRGVRGCADRPRAA